VKIGSIDPVPRGFDHVQRGIDPVQPGRIHERTQNPAVKESHRQEPKQQKQDQVDGRKREGAGSGAGWERGSLSELRDGVKKLNITAQAFDAGLRFRLHEDSERLMVQVVDRSANNEVIKEIPPEKMLDMVARIQDIIGLFIDTRR